jgi:pantothenate kinase
MSQVALSKLKFFNEYLSSDKIKDIHTDLIELIHIASIQYSRNIYKKFAKWNHIRTDWNFDYEFVKKK